MLAARNDTTMCGSPEGGRMLLMPGPSQPWDQSGDPRENTVDLPRIDLAGLTGYRRGAAAAARPEIPSSALAPLPERASETSSFRAPFADRRGAQPSRSASSAATGHSTAAPGRAAGGAADARDFAACRRAQRRSLQPPLAPPPLAPPPPAAATAVAPGHRGRVRTGGRRVRVHRAGAGCRRCARLRRSLRRLSGNN